MISGIKKFGTKTTICNASILPSYLHWQDSGIDLRDDGMLALPARMRRRETKNEDMIPRDPKARASDGRELSEEDYHLFDETSTENICAIFVLY